MTDRTKAERALAFLVHEIRDEWDERGIVVALRKVSDRPLPDVTAAALHCAVKRTDQRSPMCITFDGEHWRALGRLTGGDTAPSGQPQPPSRLTCPVHGSPEPCRDCPPPVTPEVAQLRLAEARAAIRAARDGGAS